MRISAPQMLAALLIATVAAMLASSAQAVSFPKSTDMALEWRMPATNASVAGPVAVRVTDYGRFELIAPPGAIVGVFDDTGRPATWDTASSGGTSELWFVAEPGRRYYSFWRRDQPATRVNPKSAAKPRARTPARQKRPAPDTRPDGIDPALAVIEGDVGALVIAPVGLRRTGDAPDAGTVVTGGFIRVVDDAGREGVAFQFQLGFHRAPWSSRMPLRTNPGGASPWLWLPAIREIAPATITISRADPAPAHVEYAAALSGRHVLRSLPLEPPSTGGRGRAIVHRAEVHSAAFADADAIRTDAEISRATLDAVKSMSFAGRPPREFPIGATAGHRYDLEAGRLLGFTAVQWTDASADRALFDELGYRFIYSYTHLAGDRLRGYGFRRDTNDEQMRDLADRWDAAGLKDRVYRISVFDEPGHNIAATVQTNATLYAMAKDPYAWGQMLETAGLRPEDFIDPTNPPPAGLTPATNAYWTHLRFRWAGDREADPVGLRNTMLTWAASYPTRFGNVRQAIRAHMGSNVLVTANVHDSHFFRSMPTDIEPWRMYSVRESLDVPQACDYGVGHPGGEEFMIDLLRCALRPNDKPVDAYLAAQAAYLTRPPRSLTLRAFSAVGAGARSLSFYLYGPRYLATENWFDTDREKLRAMGQISHAVGWAEDVLLAARPPRSPVAILCARDGDLWDALDVGAVYFSERRNLHHLLRGLGYQPDFISDAYLPPDAELAGIKVLFMTQRCLPAAAAARLLKWIERGGTLVALVGCGQLDEYARPQSVMTEAFGMTDLRVRDPDPGVKHALDDIPSLRIPELDLWTLGPTASVKPGGARVTTPFEDTHPAVLERALGAGRLVYFAFMPGHSYHLGAEMRNHALVGMQEPARNAVRPWLVAAGPPACASDNPLVSARLLAGPKGCAVVLVNATGSDRVERVTVRLRGTALRVAESLAQGALALTAADGAVSFSVPLGLADIIVLK